MVKMIFVHAHLYYRQSNGQLKGVGGTQTLVKSNTSLGKLTITNQNKQTGSFDVTITDVNPGYGVSEILLPTWSDKSGQDDIQWYRAEKQADGSYKASISISNHKFDTGTYHVHYYHRTADGQLKGIGGIQTTVEASATQPTGHISVSKNNNGFDVVISGVYAPSGVKEVKMTFVGIQQPSKLTAITVFLSTLPTTTTPLASTISTFTTVLTLANSSV